MSAILERIPFRALGVIVIILLGVLLVLQFFGQFVYVFQLVEEQQIGVRFQSGQIQEVVGPGVYSDVGLFVELERVSTQAIPYSVTDPEIITADKQRIGLLVSGDIFRPTDFDTIRTLWSKYRGIYLDDELAQTRISELTRQSMKVCVGDRNFDDNIIGTARDALRACIDEELNQLASEFGIQVKNVVVPEVILGEEVQAALDAIVQSRLETEKAAQDELREQALAQADQARQEGEIRVEQSRIQEQTRQQTQLAQLEQERLAAQLVVIEAERANELARVETERQLIDANKANELLQAQRDLEINAVLADAAQEKARADLAAQVALAQLYTANPDYLQLQVVEANANALKPTDKVIFTPEGTIPTLVLPGPGIVPTVDTTGGNSSNSSTTQSTSTTIDTEATTTDQ